jgi:hypothetical protein
METPEEISDMMPESEYPVADSDQFESVDNLTRAGFSEIPARVFFDGSIFYFLLPKDVAYKAGMGPESPEEKAFLPLRID